MCFSGAWVSLRRAILPWITCSANMITQHACFVPLDHAVSGVVPLSITTTNLETQNHMSCSDVVHVSLFIFLRRQDFLNWGCKWQLQNMFAHFDYSNKKGATKIFAKNTIQLVV